jgi:signal transduction histidine kinase
MNRVRSAFASASVALVLAGGAAGATVGEIAAMTREEANAASRCVVTGVVTGAFGWLGNSCVIADAADPNGPAVYVAGRLPRFPAATFVGGDRPRLGDRVEVSGLLCRLMLQPGLCANVIRKLGETDLPVPPARRLADLVSGRLNNRRARVRGVVRRVEMDGSRSAPATLVELGTPDGVLVVRLLGVSEAFASLRDAEVEAEGVVMTCFNQRAELLRPELELDSADALRVVSAAPTKSEEVGVRGGVLMWTPGGDDGHLKRMIGVVTFASPEEGFFVVQSGRAVRVYPDGASYPRVGDSVEVKGFPVLKGDCGVMESAECRVLGTAAAQPEPYRLSEDELTRLLNHEDPGELDCCDRLIAIRGRVRSVDRVQRGRLVLAVAVGTGARDLVVRFDGVLPREVEEMLLDGPLVELTGVLDVDLVRSPDTKRVLVAGEMALRLRDASDVVVVPDAAFRGRRLARRAKGVLPWLVAPLVLVVVVLLLRLFRQRSIGRAVAAERHRMAGELHDALSQHLSSARLLLFSVQQGAGAMTDGAKRSLAMMGNVLESARREVRDVVMHLQSESFVSDSPASLLKAMADGLGKMRSVRVRVNLRGLPSEMPVVEKTDLVAIVQEAITNAIKHGGAETVILVSDPLPGGGFALSVLNDGEPFDAAKALGPEAGHFGRSGLRERASRSRMALSFGSRDGFSEVRVERKGD